MQTVPVTGASSGMGNAPASGEYGNVKTPPNTSLDVF